MPNPPGAVTHLLETERERALSTRRVLGYPIWGIERYGWHERNLAQGQGGAAAQVNTAEDVSKRNQRIRESLKDVLGGRVAKGRDIWVLSSSQYRRKDASGQQRCMFTGFLEQHYGDRLLFLERNALSLPADSSDEVIYLDSVMELIAALGSNIAPLVARWVGKDSVDAFSPIGRKRLAKAGIMGQLWELAAQALVRSLKPSAVFVLCGYTRFVPLQRVLKRLGIPLIELQHGIIHTAHAGYSFDPAAPPDYTPDHMLVFGERFGQTLEACSPYWRGRWSVGGQPWLQERVQATAQSAQPDGPVVVFTQPLEPVRRQLQALLPELRRKLPRDIEIVLKPHPREPNADRDYKDALAEGVRLDSAGSDSYQLLARCRASVCVFSTLALEALAFPCRSFVLRSELWPPEIREFVDSGVLESAATAEELAQRLQQPSQATARLDLPRTLFGVGQEPPDFDALLKNLRSTS
jgi:hypothetical protein